MTYAYQELNLQYWFHCHICGTILYYSITQLEQDNDNHPRVSISTGNSSGSFSWLSTKELDLWSLATLTFENNFSVQGKYMETV